MSTFYVATLAQYVLVEAENESQARTLAIPELEKLQVGPNRPVSIRTVRPATDDEIELANWHREMADHAMNLASLVQKQNVGDQITPEEIEALPALFLKETGNPEPVDRRLFVNWLINAGMSDVLAAGLADWNGIN